MEQIGHICECNRCGLVTKIGKRFIWGHNRTLVQSDYMKSLWQNKDYYSKQCNSRKGRKIWNKGLKGIQISVKKDKTYEELYGFCKAQELKKRLSLSHKGQKCWCKGTEWAKENARRMGLLNKGRKLNQETKEKISVSNKGRIVSNETKVKLSIANKGQISHFKGRTYKEIYGDKANEQVYKRLSRMCSRPNNFEKRCADYLNNLLPNKFKYVGNGSIIINGKSPDFICEEWKVIVLCNGLYWHLFRFGLKDTLENRRMIELKEAKPFIDIGYEVWFIWEGGKDELFFVP